MGNDLNEPWRKMGTVPNSRHPPSRRKMGTVPNSCHPRRPSAKVTHPSFQACLGTNPPAENLLSPRAHEIQAPAAMTVEPGAR